MTKNAYIYRRNKSKKTNMRKGIFTLLICLVLSAVAFGQKLSDITTQNTGTSWVQFKPNLNAKGTTFFSQYKKAFGLTENDEMRLIKSETDAIGFTHYRYQQYHNNVLVFGAIYILHEKNNQLKTGNGLIVSNLKTTSKPSISSKKAVEIAIAKVSANEYAWQNKILEADLKTMTKDAKATHYPTPNLMLFSKNLSKDYTLVYKVEVFSTKPLQRVAIYVDAFSGQIFHTINMMKTSDKPTKAQTRYNGIRTITVDSVNSTQYYLRESGRGNGITTKNLQNQGDMVNVNTNLAVHIIETDTFFNEDITANNAHWASEMTYDYFLQVHNRNSYNGNGIGLFSYVHWGNAISNAMWTGSAMVYGDGGGTTGPFTTAEICGHEISHAVTQYTADLVYENEPGALNESFSDMFGSMVNLFATDTLNWLIGSQTGSAFRNMINPKQYQNPDTYKGQYWVTGTEDNGGVHTNSGVANYWFALIVQGDTGTNDKGYKYNISPIGSQKSEKIAYRALSTYLTPNSKYIDCYNATILAANDLYGECSVESKTVADAWVAVGVGRPFDTLAVYTNGITGPITDCGLTNETLNITLFYNGCNRSLETGTKIYLMAKVDVSTVYYDTLLLTTPFVGGTSITHSFSSPIDVSTIGNHRIDLWIKTEGADTYSDSIKNYQFTNRLQQNIDFAATQVLSPKTSCLLGTEETVSMSFTYLGCEPTQINDSVRLGYSINSSDTVYEYKVLNQQMNYGDTLTYTFLTKADCSQVGNNTVQVFTANTLDTLRSNNTKSITITRPFFLNDHGVLNFNESDVYNYYYKEIVQHGKIQLKTISGYPNGRVLQMTSGNVFDYYTLLEFPSSADNAWSVNEMLSAKANFCVDARTLTSLHLSFDLKQTNGSALYSQYLGSQDFSMASIMRILVNGDHYNNQTFKSTTSSADPFTNHVLNLSNYIGNVLEVSFETRNISGDIGQTLDNAYLDNLHFILNSGDDITEVNSDISFNLYPNPANQQTNLYINSKDFLVGSLQIVDFLGKSIVSKPILINNGDNLITLDLNGFANGLYMITINTKNGDIRQKMLIQK